ncbi:MAG: hypothetical protein JWR49_3407, partial [Tardiphaga sp.]|nr:hypothetical protein [Tardiphaga sp.]
MVEQRRACAYPFFFGGRGGPSTAGSDFRYSA